MNVLDSDTGKVLQNLPISTESTTWPSTCKAKEFTWPPGKGS